MMVLTSWRSVSVRRREERIIWRCRVPGAGGEAAVFHELGLIFSRDAAVAFQLLDAILRRGDGDEAAYRTPVHAGAYLADDGDSERIA